MYLEPFFLLLFGLQAHGGVHGPGGEDGGAVGTHVEAGAVELVGVDQVDHEQFPGPKF